MVKTKTLWWVVGGLWALWVVIFIVLRVFNPEFGNTRMLYWMLGGTVVGGIAAAAIYFTSSTSGKTSQYDKLPPPITLMQARSIALEALRDPMYMEEVDLEEIEDEGPSDEGKPACSVYRLIAKGKYAQKNRYAIGINMHFPETKRRIIVNPKNDYEIQRMLQKLAAFPTEEPQVRETSRINPDTGLVITTKEPVMTEKKEDEHKKDELDKTDG